ncbi:hypothetical protein [Rufibacter psychrotolerans]|uniref:hypothetical protein n=1 Tax=Rufibacter psychrotolerans TaxID=2812556 RepID=UPI001F07668D|nr:hypothetical protein [Rufibacter sp. SYSU D00308]
MGYQARKAGKSCNSLFLSDSKGLLLACCQPVSGDHHDLFEIEEVSGQLCGLLEEAGLQTDGLFLNADAGFDSEDFRRLCSERKIEANIAFNPMHGKSSNKYV